MKFALTETQKTGFLVLRPKLCDNGTYCICSKQRRPYGKAVFVRISDQYSANCIVYSNCSLYIHFLSRIPSEQSWSDKKVISECLQFVI